ncbi:Uncharacterized protein BP5553_00285 [Venustampulla echinocandica]|uniref:Glutamyl-tRNA amidotransferase complex subunit Gta3 domain-containing protein n=1 Tax=Venustampulla echinocandica TaxID=2656787 RepID=A0A370TXQ1_9HELO|nr:Uncharacterized protein BP5553_00285 [Venustampulla echinocandica]RDL40306.1 Uncharacterized protein BP5553_00285 [Venustampulla echinocandica]
MSISICSSCRAAFRQAIRSRPHSSIRSYSQPTDIAALLSKPTWSVRSLLPDPSSVSTDEITPKQLHHLLRLSALPLPKSPEEEAEMLKTLHSQLHFVKDIQKVDTEGVEPLQSIRDETEEGVKAATIGLAEMARALKKEDITGRSRRPRRRRDEVLNREPYEDWDVMGTASEKVETPGGSFFVVRSGKENEKLP